MARLGKVSTTGKWVPHELTENNRQQRAYLYFHLKTTIRTELSFQPDIII